MTSRSERGEGGASSPSCTPVAATAANCDKR
jgi:hypothetical protein